MTEPEVNWVNETIAIWKKTGTRLNIGATLDSIENAERKLNFLFPTDFKNLYQAVNGFEYSHWNKHMFSLWSLERIIEEEYSLYEEGFVCFCDYSFNIHGIGFSRTQAGVYKDYDLVEPIANSFIEAIALINENSDLIY